MEVVEGPARWWQVFFCTCKMSINSNIFSPVVWKGAVTLYSPPERDRSVNREFLRLPLMELNWLSPPFIHSLSLTITLVSKANVNNVRRHKLPKAIYRHWSNIYPEQNIHPQKAVVVFSIKTWETKQVFFDLTGATRKKFNSSLNSNGRIYFEPVRSRLTNCTYSQS